MVMRKTVSIEFMLLAVVVSATCPARTTAGAGRYLAVFADRRRVSGDNLSGWGAHPGSAHLEGVALSNPKHPLLWLRDMALNPWRAPYNCGGYVEFIGGDRIIGRVVGAESSSKTSGQYIPAHVLVKPVEKLYPPVYKPSGHVRILPGRIQRIVWGPPSKRRLNPGNLYRTDGRRLDFASVRWRKDSVTLLLDKETRDVKLSEIAEIHMPGINPWKAYYRELAALSPSLRSRLVRFETTGGLIATASETRFRASPFRTVSQEMRSWMTLMNYDNQLEQAQAHLAKIGKAVDLARKNSIAKATEFQKAQAADRQVYDKALTALKQRMDQQQKKDQAGLAEKRRKHEELLRKSEADLTKSLAGKPAAQRDKQIRDLRTRSAQSREAHKRQLESERLRLRQHRTQQIANFSRTEQQRLITARQPLVSEAARFKQQLDSQVANHANYTRHISTLRLHRAAAPNPRQGDSSTWAHIIHPVWSLDPLWTRFGSIRMRWSFSPDKVPLSRVRPVTVVNPTMLPWRADRNVAGGFLGSGGRRYAWGFGVHARSELSFTLPPHARSFHCRLGLDHFVDTGGCVRARIYVGSTQTKPRYESPMMIGSRKTADTGWISLACGPDTPKRLVLQVDPVARNYPPRADPLNIRDKFDWLDPQIALDPSGLGNEVRKRIASQVTSWRGWTLKLDKSEVCTWTNRFDETSGAGGRFLTTVRTEEQPLTLSREIMVGDDDKWMVVDAGYADGGDLHIGSITLHVAGVAIPTEKIPVKQIWMRRGAPLVFPIANYKGKKVTFEMKRAAGGRPLYWRRIAVTGQLPISYRLAQVLEKFGKKDMKVRPGLAGILASNNVSKQVKETVLEIHRLGGEVNYRGLVTLWFALDPTRQLDGGDIVNALIGRNWKGGDNGLMLLKKLPGLSFVAVTRTSGVSKEAAAKLKTAMPNVRVHSLHRSPSTSYAPRCSVTVRNGSGKEVALFILSRWGSLQGFARLKPGRQIKHTSGIGNRYEAHLITKDYNKSKPISRFIANPNALWDIKSK
ncbi:MAG: NPCBM/NEW2 domain-containing protein [Phycisphaerae bacterium]|jgi:hypothetical protein|nr:NPCBM/NEW2 domain-containing protein [Phycisphaerae bacterium]